MGKELKRIVQDIESWKEINPVAIAVAMTPDFESSLKRHPLMQRSDLIGTYGICGMRKYIWPRLNVPYKIYYNQVALQNDMIMYGCEGDIIV